MDSIKELKQQIADLTAQVERLEQWKREQLDVESAWNPQAVGAELGLRLGSSIRPHILPAITVLKDHRDALKAQMDRINTPELKDFSSGVYREALHQRLRCPSDHDAGKQPEDWFWLVGYLGGKALRAHLTGDSEKALHHTISTAAALANWHAAILGASNQMRPGIDPVERGIDAAISAPAPTGEQPAEGAREESRG